MATGSVTFPRANSSSSENAPDAYSFEEPVDHALIILQTCDEVKVIMRGLYDPTENPLDRLVRDREEGWIWVDMEDLVLVGAPMMVVDPSLLCKLTTLDVVMHLGLCDLRDDGEPSKSSALRVFKQNGYRINNQSCSNPDRLFCPEDVHSYYGADGFDMITISRGKADPSCIVIPWPETEPD